MKQLAKGTRIWTVEMSTPPKGEGWYRQNVYVTVCAANAFRAMEIAQAKHPDATVWSLQNRSRDHKVLVDDGVIVQEPNE